MRYRFHEKNQLVDDCRKRCRFMVTGCSGSGDGNLLTAEFDSQESISLIIEVCQAQFKKSWSDKQLTSESARWRMTRDVSTVSLGLLLERKLTRLKIRSTLVERKKNNEADIIDARMGKQETRAL